MKDIKYFIFFVLVVGIWNNILIFGMNLDAILSGAGYVIAEFNKYNEMYIEVIFNGLIIILMLIAIILQAKKVK